MVTAAFFVALDIIVARYLGFEFPSPVGPIKFDFQLVVAALCGYALGPLWGCLTLVTSDLLGVMLNAGSLGIFFGFTVSALLRGLLFGLLLYNKPLKPLRIIAAAAIVFVSVDFFLNAFWLSILTGTPYFVLIPTRVVLKMPLLVVDVILLLCLPKLFSIVNTKHK